MENLSANSDLKFPSLATDLLSRFGLTRLESRLYIELLDLGQTSAKDLVSATDLNRVEAYRVLKKLVARGLVEVILARPNVYRAVDPFVAVSNLVAESEDSLRQLRERASELVAMLEATRSQKSRTQPSVSERVYFCLKGGRQIIWQWKDMMTHAKQVILRVWSEEGMLLNDHEGLLEIMAGCKSRGVEIRGITEISNRNLAEVEEWSKVITLRHRELGPAPLRYMLVDNSELIITTSFSAKPSELTAVYTNHETLVSGIRAEFQDIWKTSTPASIIVKRIRESLETNDSILV